jgi:hypothetical protein
VEIGRAIAPSLPGTAPKSYEALLGAARGFVTAIGPVKAAFVERGLPADFDEQLADKVATFEDATSRKHDGRLEQKAGTVSLQVETRRGMAATRELDQIISNRLKRTDPVLLAVWKAAKQLEHLPASEPAAPAPPAMAMAMAAAPASPAASAPAPLAA